jgi:hypothetical protein
METFRTQSMPFKSISWRTDVLYTPGGLEKLTDISEVSVR